METTYNTTIENLGTETIPIGRAGENGYRAVAIDCTAWLATLPNGQLFLIVENPNGDVYEAQGVSISDGVLTWTVSDVDAQYRGIGAIQLSLIDGDTIAKSTIAKISVYPSLGIGGDYPTPAENWLDAMIAAQQSTENAASSAVRSAANAENSEIRANMYADRAEDAAVNQPIIRNGNWWTWNRDTGEYADTGEQAEGPQGPQGEQGIQGPQGDKGDTGETGPGVPQGGTAGQYLVKTSAADYAAGWATPFPSMAAYNTEYKTGEFFLGKPIYAQIVAPDLPTTTGTPLRTDVNVPGIDRMVSYQFFATTAPEGNLNQVSFPYDDGSNKATISVSGRHTGGAETGHIYIIAMLISGSAFIDTYKHAYGIVKYTKV